MIAEFERVARQDPSRLFCSFVDGVGNLHTYTYDEMRIDAAVIAATLYSQGVSRGSSVVVDMANSPAFVKLALAAAYGGFTLVVLNHRLTESEKAERLLDIQGIRDIQVGAQLDEAAVNEILARPLGEEILAPQPKGFFRRKQRKEARNAQAQEERLTLTQAVHFAERGAAFFAPGDRALVMFTSGTSGRPKAVPLTWENLCGAAMASNAAIGPQTEGLWQLALPMYHIGGFEIMVRSVLAAVPFVLYGHFDPQRILADALDLDASHISVVDKMLQDLLASEQANNLMHYRCILLGGALPNPATLQRAAGAGARVYASYGMTETSSQVASQLVTKDYDGSCALLPGYEAQVAAPDENGVGQLAVKGPGVFAGYLNARAAFTADGFFLTGDRAAVRRNRIVMQERLDDMFVSGGENIYPAEIQDKLMRVPGISDAYVFGVEDPVWGRRPVALIERTAVPMPISPDEVLAQTAAGRAVVAAPVSGDVSKPAHVLAGPSREAAERAEALERLAAEIPVIPGDPAAAEVSLQRFCKDVVSSLDQRLSRVYMPKAICALDEFPRTGVGKVDREALRRRYDERLEITKVTMYHVRQKLTTPFATAKTTIRSRESIIIEIEDWAGRTGVSECVAFSTDWYLPEILPQDESVLAKHLIPLVLDQVYLHPREVAKCFDECVEAKAFPLARGALEPAFWDLYGKIVGQPLSKLVGGSPQKAARAGVTIGLSSPAKAVEAVGQAVAAGYDRVKLKIKPGNDIERVRAVRESYPQITIMLDANQSYSERDVETLKALDAFGIRCIEEPLDPKRVPAVGPTDLFPRLARLQKQLDMAVCLDESIVTKADLERALAYPELACIALKIGKFGGVSPALDFCELALRRGIEVWMAGMYETSISKRLHAAFETLPGITIPGDISETARYFPTEIARPALEIADGTVVLNSEGYEAGLGCELDHEAMSAVLRGKRVFRRET